MHAYIPWTFSEGHYGPIVFLEPLVYVHIYRLNRYHGESWLFNQSMEHRWSNYSVGSRHLPPQSPGLSRVTFIPGPDRDAPFWRLVSACFRPQTPAFLALGLDSLSIIPFLLFFFLIAASILSIVTFSDEDNSIFLIHLTLSPPHRRPASQSRQPRPQLRYRLLIDQLQTGHPSGLLCLCLRPGRGRSDT